MNNFEDAISLSHFSSHKDACQFLREYNRAKLNEIINEHYIDVARKITHTKALLELNNFSTSNILQGNNLIFIVGLPRSGKTSLEKIIANDPACIDGGELGIISDMFSSYEANGEIFEYPLYMKNLTDDDFIHMGQKATDHFIKITPDQNKKLIITMPSNFLYIALLQKILPDAKIIWCNRNKKHHALNLFIKSFKSNYWNFTYDITEIVKVIKAHDKFHSFSQKKMKDNFLSINYEDFLRDTKQTLKNISKYLNLGWTTSIIQSHIQSQRNYINSIESEDAQLRNYIPYFDELNDL